MKTHRILSLILVAAMLLPVILGGCDADSPMPTDPSVLEELTQPSESMPVAETEVYNGMTASQLDAIPCVIYNGFRHAMDSTWNFGWDSVVSSEAVAAKVDFTGTAAEQTLWHVGTKGEEGAATVENFGWGVALRTIGKENVAYMYNKVRIPASTTEFRVWAVGNTDYSTSGEGAFRTLAIFRENGGEYVTQILKPLSSSFTGAKTTTYHEDGTIRFKNAKWNMPDTVDGCMISYDISNLPTDQDVIILIEAVGIGNVLGDEYSEAAEGTPIGAVMSDLVIIKRVMVVASTVPVEEGTEPSVPINNQEQELLFKVVDKEGLYLNFLPPTTYKYAKAPVLLLICGGGWKEQSRSAILSMMQALVSDLRAEGFAVVAADYRVITDSNHLTAKEQVTDLMDALRYIVHYADVLGIDPQKIATSGHSAGAHLAMMVAHAPQDLFPGNGFDETYGVFACAPLAAVTTIPGTYWSYIANVNGVYDPELAELLSPYTHIRADNAPTLLIHGDMDDVVPFSNAQICMEKAKELGAPYEILVSEWGNHVLTSPIRGQVASPSLNEAMHIAADWICRQLEQ